jgi:hypothetical protein
VTRKFTIRRSNRRDVRAGEQAGREDRSVNGSPARNLAAHFAAVAGETWKRSAARRIVQPSITINWASR